MSRTTKSSRPLHKEYWGKRPLSNTHGATPGRETKKLTHRLERNEAKEEVKKQVDESETEEKV